MNISEIKDEFFKHFPDYPVEDVKLINGAIYIWHPWLQPNDPTQRKWGRDASITIFESTNASGTKNTIKVEPQYELGRVSNFKQVSSRLWKRIETLLVEADKEKGAQDVRDKKAEEDKRAIEVRLEPLTEKHGPYFLVESSIPFFNIGNFRFPVDIERETISLNGGGTYFNRLREVPLDMAAEFFKQVELYKLIAE